MSPRPPSAAPRAAGPAPLLDPLLPILVALVLCAPVLGIGYIWDDYYFLTAAQSDPTRYLRPLEGATFFRPISQGLYFLLLLVLGPAGPIAGHILNLALIAIVIVQLTRLGTRLAGRRAGIAAGIAFAALAPVPTLVGWISCSQDLLAMAFFLGAVLALDSGRTTRAALLALAALLSKETVITLLPLLVTWDWVRGRGPQRVARNAMWFGAPALIWMAVHPGIRALLAHSLRSGATGYVGLEHPERWGNYAVGYLTTLLNLPATGMATPWPADRTLVAVLAIGALLAGWLWRPVPAGAPREPLSLGGIALIGELILVPSVLLTSIFVRRWNPYFAAIPSLGSSLILGALAAKIPGRAAVLIAAGFIVLGTWCRGIQVPGGVAYTERDCVAADRAARHLDRTFHALHPEFPHGARLLVSVAGTGTLGVHGTLIDNQAARIWYRDASLTTQVPQRWDGGRPEFLFRVTPDLDVVEIDPSGPAFRTASGRMPEPDEVGRTVRSYARGVAARGEGDRAVAILAGLAVADQDLLRNYDLRLAALLRLRQGNRAAADSLIARTPPLPRAFAIDMIAKLEAEPAGGEFDPTLADTSGFAAFDLSASDPEVLRRLIQLFVVSGYREQAVAYARRLNRLVPGDPLARSVLREL